MAGIDLPEDYALYVIEVALSPDEQHVALGLVDSPLVYVVDIPAAHAQEMLPNRQTPRTNDALNWIPTPRWITNDLVLVPTERLVGGMLAQLSTNSPLQVDHQTVVRDAAGVKGASDFHAIVKQQLYHSETGQTEALPDFSDLLFSSDGQTLVLETGDDSYRIRAVDPPGAKVYALPDYVYPVFWEWSPTRVVIFSPAGIDLYPLPPSDSIQSIAPNDADYRFLPTTHSLGAPGWSPDYGHLAFIKASTHGSPSSQTLLLMIVSP